VSTATQSSGSAAILPPERDTLVAVSSRPSHTVLKFENVCKSYLRNAGRALLRHRLASWLKRTPMETFRALDDVSFEVRSGESLAVVGSNGAAGRAPCYGWRPASLSRTRERSLYAEASRR
jgi:ABC-type glutathione transport system ATPase component